MIMVNPWFTIDDMCKVAEARGGKCLSDEYINGKTKLEWECKEGHMWWAIPNSVRGQGRWCPDCAGNIKKHIDENEVKKLYNKKLSMREMAKILDCSTIVVDRLFKEYNLKPWKRYERLAGDFDVSVRQRNIMLGSLLGDASLTRNGKYYYFAVVHSMKQYEYIKKIEDELKNLLIKSYQYDAKCRGKLYPSYRVATHSHPFFTEFRDKLYPNGKKQVTMEYLEMLSPISLAYWYMDDGYKRKNRSPELHTEGFTYNEQEIMVQYFKDRWDIDAYIAKVKKIYNILRIRDSLSFFELIGDFIIPSMKYKMEKI